MNRYSNRPIGNGAVPLAILMVLLWISGPRPVPAQQTVADMAHTACEGVGVVGETSHGTHGTPIIILEEVHDSRAGQIQHAIALVRLYNRFGLKDIALEGYLKEDPAIDAKWYIQAAKEDLRAKLNVAVQLLKEGEISCAEFIKLTCENVSLHPIETAAEYHVELDSEAQQAPLMYLIQIAQGSLRQSHLPKIKKLQKEIASLEGSAKTRKIGELVKYILSADPWAEEKAKLLRDENFLRFKPLEEHAATVREIEMRREDLRIKIDPRDEAALGRYLAFFEGRAKADSTMAKGAMKIAAQKRGAIIAMIIGAGHTKKIFQMLKNAQRPFAVITPLALKKGKHAGDLTAAQLDRKYQNRSVFSAGFFARILDESYPHATHKKPQPVLPEPWLQAKSELYLFTDKITRLVLGGGGGGKPPIKPRKGVTRFPEGNFNGKFVFINSSLIEIVNQDEEDEKSGYAILFPVVLKSGDSKKETQIWIKAALTTTAHAAVWPETQKHEKIEDLLKKALKEVQSETNSSELDAEEGGFVVVTKDVRAFIGSTSAKARKANLSGK